MIFSIRQAIPSCSSLAMPRMKHSKEKYLSCQGCDSYIDDSSSTWEHQKAGNESGKEIVQIQFLTHAHAQVK